MGSGGVLYGAAQSGGVNGAQGTVFSLTPPTAPGGAWTETTLYDFLGGADGSEPVAGVVIGAGGVLYGTTEAGGTGGTRGTVFSLTPPSSPGGSWTEVVLYKFAGSPSDGANPFSGVVIGTGGVLYGTTGPGGSLGDGTVFSLTPPLSPGGSWTESVLYNFTGGSDGSGPEGVVIGSGGVLYGTTSGAGNTYCDFGCGTVFSLTT
jgi:hypothetical protein